MILPERPSLAPSPQPSPPLGGFHSECTLFDGERELHRRRSAARWHDLRGMRNTIEPTRLAKLADGLSTKVPSPPESMRTSERKLATGGEGQGEGAAARPTVPARWSALTGEFGFSRLSELARREKRPLWQESLRRHETRSRLPEAECCRNATRCSTQPNLTLVLSHVCHWLCQCSAQPCPLGNRRWQSHWHTQPAERQGCCTGTLNIRRVLS